MTDQDIQKRIDDILYEELAPVIFGNTRKAVKSLTTLYHDLLAEERGLESRIISLGHRFRQLSYHSGGYWIAKGKKNADEKWHLFNGKTPVEAINKLINSFQNNESN